MNAAAVGLFFLLNITLGLFQPAMVPTVFASTPELRAVSISEPIILDGRLNEPAWQTAQVADDFRQREPDEGERASQSTEVRVLYSHSQLYIGVTCHDSDPSAIVVTRYNRDSNLDADDRVTLLFDTFLDHRNAFKFQTNSVGTRVDELIGDQGESENRDWNGIWNAIP